MNRKFISVVIGGALALGAWTTAEATFPIPDCPPGEFTFIARELLSFELRPQNSPPTLVGNALVTQDDGVAQIRGNNKIVGTLVARRIVLGTNAVVDNCVADVIEGNGSCTNVLGTFAAAPLACKEFTFVPPVIDALCVNAALAVLVPPGGTESLAPGCYRDVRVGVGGVLNLEAGNYFFRNLTVQAGGTLDGVGRATNVAVLNNVNISGFGTDIKDLDIATAAQSGQFQIFNNATLTNVRLISAATTIHVHTGSVGSDAVIVGNAVDIEPTTFSSPPPPPPIVCVCPPSTHFAVETCQPDTTCQQARACVPD